MGDLPQLFQVPLPISVERTIKLICEQRNLSPPSPKVRQMLAAIAEEDAFEVVTRIHNSPGPVRHLSRLIGYRIRNYSPQDQASPSGVSRHSGASPSFSSPAPSSARTASSTDYYSPSSAAARPPAAYSSPPSAPSPPFSSSFSAAPAPLAAHSSPLFAAANTSHPSAGVFPLSSFPNDGEGSSSGARDHRSFLSSSSAAAGSSVVNRRLPFNDDDFGGRTNSDKTYYVLMILDQLEFRKFFLLLSYLGRHKLEEILSPDDAHSIASMKDIPMADFESHIWSKYGNHFLRAEDRRQSAQWDSGKTHLYYCDVYQDGSFSFKGPCLTTTRTHLQRSLGDHNVLIVKFVGEEIGYANFVSREGILVGLKRYHFFVFKDESKDVKKKDRNSSENGKESASKNIKCYFVKLDSIGLSGMNDVRPFCVRDIAEARCLFMHIHKVSSMAKYMARFSLILSKTIKLPVDLSSVVIENIEDIPGLDEHGSIVHDEDKKPLIHTDGTGFISEDLALLCPQDFGSAKHIKEKEFQKFRDVIAFTDIPCGRSGSEAWNRELPLLMQCRLFREGLAVKGTLLLNRKLRRTIQIRPSMVKVERDKNQPDAQTFDSLEIVAVSHKPRRNYLSKNLIALLSYGGVPRKIFLDLLTNALDDTLLVFSNKHAALKVSLLHGEIDDDYTAAKMINAGVPLNEPHLQDRLSKLAKVERRQLKDGKLPIGESFYLMGTADPTGVLNSNEVCVILENGQISGKVLVYRNPGLHFGDIRHGSSVCHNVKDVEDIIGKCTENGQISGKVLVYRNPGLHFGDIHVMEAVYVKDLEDIIGNAKYGIFFSTKGRRSAAAEMGNGDFDGDMYWVSRNPQLLGHFRASEPWSRKDFMLNLVSKKPSEYSAEALEPELFRQFLKTRKPSLSMAVAADSWLSFMDQLLMLEGSCVPEKDNLKKKMLRLIDIYYDAIDAPKSGKKVDVAPDMRAEKFPHYMGKGSRSYRSTSVLGEMYDRIQQFESEEGQSKGGIWKLPFFIHCIETRSLGAFLNLWRKRYEDYRKEMTNALKTGSKDSKNANADEVMCKYKLMLYEAEDLNGTKKDSTQICDEALAIYHLSYDYAIRVNERSRCSFAWKVAGPALCKHLASNQNETAILTLPSVLKEVL